MESVKSGSAAANALPGGGYTSFEELPLFLSIPQAAALLHISRSTAYALVKDGCGIPVLRIGRRTLVPKDGLFRWIRENTHTDAPPGGRE